MRWFFPLLLVSSFLGSAVSFACPECGAVRHGLLVEGKQFPGLVDTLTGAFRKHTTEFHKWRIKDREAKIASENRKAMWYDDLALSHDALGDHAAAVKVMEEKALFFPDLYETEAYRGTFLVHAGKYEEGIAHLQKAIERAAAGRKERDTYQKYLAEYILARQAAGRENYPYGKGGPKFPDFLEKKFGRELTTQDTHNAIAALQEVLRLNSHQSPVVLEAMGETLERQNRADNNLEYMTAAAFLQAARYAEGDEAKAYLDQRAVGAVRDNRFLKDACREELERFIKAANEEFEAQRLKEMAWIKSGVDLDLQMAQVAMVNSAPHAPVAPNQVDVLLPARRLEQADPPSVTNSDAQLVSPPARRDDLLFASVPQTAFPVVPTESSPEAVAEKQALELAAQAQARYEESIRSHYRANISSPAAIVVREVPPAQQESFVRSRDYVSAALGIATMVIPGMLLLLIAVSRAFARLIPSPRPGLARFG